ncbi:hypothetical protein SAMN05444851_0245 [Aliiroseovarius sediminilitoris]|uniref:Uncharacterized protein n=1 Tax=Aliiroseovarius sediminilitoris TaxID=1173584 RepID=A0A1I0MQF1_9RHOB|nr:hypothetical protein SAMN05444851_0245 [Aliiroseovarius sediminilitoris]
MGEKSDNFMAIVHDIGSISGFSQGNSIFRRKGAVDCPLRMRSVGNGVDLGHAKLAQDAFDSRDIFGVVQFPELLPARVDFDTLHGVIPFQKA